MKDKINVKCIKESTGFFTEGEIYEAFWNNGELLTMDNYGHENHTIAEGSLNHPWFKEHFEVVG